MCVWLYDGFKDLKEYIGVERTSYITRVTTLQTMWNSLTIQCMIRNQNEMHKLSKVKNWRKYLANNKQFYATFLWQDFSLTAVKFTDISRFSNEGFPDKWSLIDTKYIKSLAHLFISCNTPQCHVLLGHLIPMRAAARRPHDVSYR